MKCEIVREQKIIIDIENPIKYENVLNIFKRSENHSIAHLDDNGIVKIQYKIMQTSLYQYCNHCKDWRNFNPQTMLCLTCNKKNK